MLRGFPAEVRIMAHGMHFFMNPGPTNIPDRILRAMDRGAIDFTAAQFKAITEECFERLKRIFKTEQTILAYAATGHGAWEAALVDTVSSLASIDFRTDEWGVAVVVAGSQKGLMLPTGMAFTAISGKALAAAAAAKLPRVYWDWKRLMGEGSQAYWNGTAPVHFFYGLQEALRMLEEEGLDNVFARHHRLAEATRRAVRAWRSNDGPEIFASEPGAQSNTVTAVLVPEGSDADKVRQTAIDRFNVSLGGGLHRLRGRVLGTRH